MKRNQLENSNKYQLHHTGSKRGYVSRKSDVDQLSAEKYNGRFGRGYTVEMPRFDSSQYVYVEYWIEN